MTTTAHRGSESGCILRDEEYCDGARITLERDCQAPFAITCGIYDWLVHTRFLGVEAEAQSEFDRMKAELFEIMTAIPLAADPNADSKLPAMTESLSDFVKNFRSSG